MIQNVKYNNNNNNNNVCVKILSHPGHSYPSIDLFVQLDWTKIKKLKSTN